MPNAMNDLSPQESAVDQGTDSAAGDPTAFTAESARAYIAKVRWQFAKTMPQWPHEYTVLAWQPESSRDFYAFVELIRREGAVKPWPRDAAVPRYHHTYLPLDGWEYWTMGAPVHETTLINRGRLPLTDPTPDDVDA